MFTSIKMNQKQTTPGRARFCSSLSFHLPPTELPSSYSYFNSGQAAVDFATAKIHSFFNESHALQNSTSAAAAAAALCGVRSHRVKRSILKRCLIGSQFTGPGVSEEAADRILNHLKGLGGDSIEKGIAIAGGDVDMDEGFSYTVSDFGNATEAELIGHDD